LPVVVLGVDPEVIREAVDALGEQRYLDPGSSGVRSCSPCFLTGVVLSYIVPVP